MAFDLDAYLERLGHAGPVRADLATLMALHKAQTDVIPFEDIDVLMDRPIRLDADSLAHKLVTRRRGGYCFEQNGLLRLALQAIGFEVTGMIARIRINRPDDAPTGLTHMVLRVRVDGQDWLADVGFSAFRLTQPLRLVPDIEQPTHLEIFRLATRGDELRLEADIGSRWAPAWQVRPVDVPDIDFEMGNWYTSTHPDSRFKSDLILGSASPAGRRTMLNNRLTLRDAAGNAEITELSTVDDLAEAIARHFGIDDLSADERAMLQRFIPR